MEVASPGAGVLREILKEEQEEIAPGELLGRIEAAEAGGGAGAAGAGEEPAGANSAATAGHVAAHAVRVGTSPAASGEVQSAAVSASSGAGRATASQDGAAAARLSPAVRRLLSENTLDPSTIRGTGRGGRITVEDVLAAAASGSGAAVGGASIVGSTGGGMSVNGSVGQAPTAPLSVATVASAGSTAAPAFGTSDVAGGGHRIPHTSIRKRVAEHMVQSLLHTAPHVTTVFEADMTAVLAHRAYTSR